MNERPLSGDAWGTNQGAGAGVLGWMRVRVATWIAALAWPLALGLGPTFGLVATLVSAPPAEAQTAPRLLAQRSQTLCRLPQTAATDRPLTLLFDSAQSWSRQMAASAGPGAAPDFGRKLRWSREQVLLHVLPEQATMGVQVTAQGALAGPVLLLQVSRPAPGQMAPMALSRPCVWAVVTRSSARPWRVRVQDPEAAAVQTVEPVRPAK